MRLYDYIREEVSRQGHDVTQAEGQLRIAWMWDAWEWAQARSHDSQRPLSLDDIAHIGKRIEPDKNARGFRTVGVRVGPRLCPPPADVIPQLTDLLMPMTTRSEPPVRRDLFVYLSGPMTAAHGYRVDNNVAAGLRACMARGIPAFSPHAIGAFPTTWDRPRWLAYDCAVIDHCTHVLLLPRWETSPVARAERAYALSIGTPVITSLDELEAT